MVIVQCPVLLYLLCTAGSIVLDRIVKVHSFLLEYFINQIFFLLPIYRLLSVLTCILSVLLIYSIKFNVNKLNPLI